jgi:predicted nuclease of predicted toxin-antitoxin system
MRFKLDECVPVELAGLFRAEGYGTETVVDEKLVGKSDRFLLDSYKTENRVFVTTDKGLGNIIEYPPKDFGGIVLLRPKGTNFESFKAVVSSLIDYLKLEEGKPDLNGKLAVVTPNRRVRIV